MRDAVLSKSDQFAVDDGIAPNFLKSLGDLDVAAADDLAVAAVKRDLAPRISATIRKPSNLSSNIQPGSSNGASVRVASMG